MHFVTYQSQNGQPLLGLLQSEQIVPIQGPGLPGSMLELIQGGDAALAAVRAHVATAKGFPAGEVQLLAPIPRPLKNVFCVGRNYMEHVAEGDRANRVNEGAPPVPIFFTKTPNSVVGPEAPVVHHRQTEKLDYEVELAVVIGKAGKDIPEAHALDYIWGYTVVNDVTARDLQDKHKQWFKGKSMDTFCPMGPALVHASAIPDPHSLDIELRVNGVVRQKANTAEMIFNINRIIAELSAGMTLEPGDVIATGTCSGCAFGMTPPAWLVPGDVIEARVQGIGLLRNPVVRG